MIDTIGSATSERDSWRSRKQFLNLPNGTRIAYVGSTCPEPFPLVFIHGFTDSSRSWSNFVGKFPDRYFIAPDLRGHGDTSSSGYGYSVAHHVDDIALLLDRLGIERATLVGHSLGGRIAQLFAAALPDRVESLVLINAASEPHGTFNYLYQFIEQWKQPIDPDGEFMMRWYANPGYVDADFLSKLRRDCAQIPYAALRQAILQNQLSSLTQILPTIEARTLILWGDGDPIFSRGSQEMLASQIPCSRLMVLEGLGHNPFWEQPDDVAAIIRDFLQE